MCAVLQEPMQGAVAPSMLLQSVRKVLLRRILVMFAVKESSCLHVQAPTE